MVREKLVGVEDLTKLPLSMPQCCKMLGLRHGTLVHRDIVANIIRLTAYHKLHLNEKGRLQIREGKSLALTFKSLVDEFLDVRKTGIHYFPNHLPAREGWYASYIDVHDRLLWTLKNDKPKIWAGIALMFEQVKADARFSSSKFLGYLPEVSRLLTKNKYKLMQFDRDSTHLMEMIARSVAVAIAQIRATRSFL